MAAFNKFEQFVLDLGSAVHDLQAAGHLLKVFLTDGAPSVSADVIKTDLTEIGAGNGYTAGGDDAQNDYTEVTGVGSCTGIDIVWTASGGTIGSFQYAVLYNDTPASPLDPLVSWWDYGSSITLNDGETFTVNFGVSMFTIT